MTRSAVCYSADENSSCYNVLDSVLLTGRRCDAENINKQIKLQV